MERVSFKAEGQPAASRQDVEHFAEGAVTRHVAHEFQRAQAVVLETELEVIPTAERAHDLFEVLFVKHKHAAPPACHGFRVDGADGGHFAIFVEHGLMARSEDKFGFGAVCRAQGCPLVST